MTSLLKKAAGFLPPSVRRTLKHIQVSRSLVPLESIQDVQKRHQDFAGLRALVCAAGTDKLGYFPGYTSEGGLSLQQHPDEFTALCLFLRERRPFKTYMEIGSGSGGACRFLHEHVGFERVLSLDDGNHPRAPEQKGNFSTIANFEQYLGDSHAPEAAEFLAQNVRGKLDVAFIDGDHSYEGALQDVELTLPFCRPGTLMIFHDTIACPEVRAVWHKVVQAAKLKPLAEFIGDARPLGIAIGAVA